MSWDGVNQFLKPDSFKLLVVFVFLTIFVILSMILVYFNMFANSVVEFRENRELELSLQGKEMPIEEKQNFEEWFAGIETDVSDIKFAYALVSPVASDEKVVILQTQLLPTTMPSISWIQVLNLIYWYLASCVVAWIASSLRSKFNRIQ